MAGYSQRQNINSILKQVRSYARKQSLIDLAAGLIITLAAIMLCTMIALFFLKSPVYGLIGITPILFYRWRRLIDRARELEQKSGLNGELVNSIQLSSIPPENKENYSKELIDAYIEKTASKIKDLDFKKHLSYDILSRAFMLCLVTVALCLVYPSFFSSRFWFSLNHTVAYGVRPLHGRFDKGSEVNIELNFLSPYIPGKATLVTDENNQPTREILTITGGTAQKKLAVNRQLTYYFEFFDRKTQLVTLSVIEPVYIERLEFYLVYPAWTKMKDEVKTSRHLVAPAGTKVAITGKTSQDLNSAYFEYIDTTALTCSKNTFSGEFIIDRSATAMLHLVAGNESKEPIEIYSIPDMAPLVDIFYPGYDIVMPTDMKVNLGVRCSDDYGLQEAVLYSQFKTADKKTLRLTKNALEDTIYFDWDMSALGLLPGDQISYYVLVKDNGGNSSKSRNYSIYFPTIEQIYQEVSEKENVIQDELSDIKTEHNKEMTEVSRIEENIMKDRELSWMDKEKLKDVLGKEQKIVDKINEWQRELEKTIEKLNNGIVLDQASIERLQEITKILQELAPEDMQNALENLKIDLNKNPGELKKALENLKDAQEELAKALERTLEILKRYQQEEKLKELARKAKDLANKAEEIRALSEKNKELQPGDNISELQKKIDSLATEMNKLAQSEGLESEIKEGLHELSQQAGELSKSTQPMEMTEQDLNNIAADLERLYEQLTQGRADKLRKNILETMNHLIDISKFEEELSMNEKINTELQDQVIKATRAITDSMYAQQTKSLYITPGTGKRLARAIKEMEQARIKSSLNQNGGDNAREAMQQINIACLELLESLKKGSEGSSSTGMDKLMQNLSNISQGQMSLGQSLQGIFPIPMSGLSAEQMAQIRSLAGKQRELREALDALKNEPSAGQYQDMLDNMSEEMKEMEEALYQYKLDRKLIERQKILISRLLDAQKSIRQEDYRKERISKPGEEILRVSPLPLPGELGKDELREIIQRALKEPYPEEYEVYIREYFKSLLEEQ